MKGYRKPPGLELLNSTVKPVRFVTRKVLAIAPGVSVKFFKIGGFAMGLPYCRSEATTYLSKDWTYAYARMTWA